MLHTTFKLLKAHSACVSGYMTLRRYLPKDYGYDSPIKLTTILESNDLSDAIWAMRAVLPEEHETRNEVSHKLIVDFLISAILSVSEHYPDSKVLQNKLQIIKDTETDLTITKKKIYNLLNPDLLTDTYYSHKIMLSETLVDICFYARQLVMYNEGNACIEYFRQVEIFKHYMEK